LHLPFGDPRRVRPVKGRCLVSDERSLPNSVLHELKTALLTQSHRINYWWKRLHSGSKRGPTVKELEEYLCAVHKLNASEAGDIQLPEIVEMLKRDAQAAAVVTVPPDTSPKKPGPKGPRYDREKDLAVFAGWKTWKAKAEGKKRPCVADYAKEAYGATSRQEIKAIRDAMERVRSARYREARQK